LKPRVYIAYTNKDGIGLKYALELKKWLEAEGYPDIFFFDHSKRDHLGGKVWDVLTSEIKNHEIMVVICTPVIAASAARREYNTAINFDRKVIPLKYDDAKVPDTIAVDLRDDFNDTNYSSKFETFAKVSLPKSYQDYLVEQNEKQAILAALFKPVPAKSAGVYYQPSMLPLPKVSQLPLSQTRLSRFVFEAKDTFERNCLARMILRPEYNQRRTTGFSTLRIDRIIDRIWFVDGVFDGQVFATPSGASYGDPIAEAETELVLNRVIQSTTKRGLNDYVNEVDGNPTEKQIQGALDELRERGFEPSIILTNIYQSFNFWQFSKFVPLKDQRRGLTSPEGHFQNVPVLHSRLLPNGLTLIADSQKLGSIVVKSDFEMSVVDPHVVDRRLILEHLPEIAEMNLDEKVLVHCAVTVEPSVDDLALKFVATGGTPLSVGAPKQ